MINNWYRTVNHTCTIDYVAVIFINSDGSSQFSRRFLLTIIIIVCLTLCDVLLTSVLIVVSRLVKITLGPRSCAVRLDLCYVRFLIETLAKFFNLLDWYCILPKLRLRLLDSSHVNFAVARVVNAHDCHAAISPIRRNIGAKQKRIEINKLAMFS